MGIKPARFQVGVADESSDFQRRFENRIWSKLSQITILPDGLDHATYAPARLINRDRKATALEVKRRCQPRDAGADDGNGFQIVLECFRSPTGASVLSKHIAMLRMKRRPVSVTSRPADVRFTSPSASKGASAASSSAKCC